MNAYQLAGAYGLILLMAAIARWRRVGVEGDVFVSSVRAAVQLVLMGYVIQWIFDLQHTAALVALLAAMVALAGRISARRGAGVERAYPVALAAIGLATVAIVGTLVVLGVIAPTGRYLIPLGGMVIGNTMNVTSQTLNRFQAEVTARRAEVETLLSLGASRRQAAEGLLRETVRAAMIAP
ncbi:MAG: iron export ABC transporter permease subunit FetB, partial [Nitrospirae bacterium CG_4_10_14_3_um_filter_70_108]